MTRTELINAVYAADYESRDNWKQLHHCTAYYREIEINGKRYIELKSYRTIVAIYSEYTGTVYEFSRYSATTTQHVRKFAYLMDANRITKLHRDTTGYIECRISWYGNDFKPTREEWKCITQHDYSLEIETI